MKPSKRFYFITLIILTLCMSLIGLAYNKNLFLHYLQQEYISEFYLSLLIFFGSISILFAAYFLLFKKIKPTFSLLVHIIAFTIISPVLFMGVLSYLDISNVLTFLTTILFLAILSGYFYLDYEKFNHEQP